MSTATTTPAELARIVHSHAADMPAREAGFWAAADGVDPVWAAHLLDIAVEWIGAGWTDEVDPYRLALAWSGR